MIPRGPGGRTRARVQQGICHLKLGRSYKDQLTTEGSEISQYSLNSADEGLDSGDHDQVDVIRDFSDAPSPRADADGPQCVQDLLTDDYYDAEEDPAYNPTETGPVADSPSGASADESQDEVSSLQAKLDEALNALEEERNKNAKLQEVVGERDSEDTLPAHAAFRPLASSVLQTMGHASRTPDLSKVLNKPPTYNGSPSSDLRLWLTIVAAYLTASQLRYPMAVATAVSYLVGDAAKFWHSHAPKLSQQGKDIYDWQVFKKALYERFGYKNAEHAARDRLHDLEQRNMSFAQYVNAFDDCYAHIPHYDEADKVHRFLRGLRPGLRNKLCINPATAKRWTRYNAMVAYGHNLMNESNVTGPPADIIADVSATAARNPKRPAPPAADRPAGSTKKPKTGPTVSTTAGARGRSVPGGTEFTVVRRDGSRFTFVRDNHVSKYCRKAGICAHCYKTGHTPDVCRSNRAVGDPPAPFDRNYQANLELQQKSQQKP